MASILESGRDGDRIALGPGQYKGDIVLSKQVALTGSANPGFNRLQCGTIIEGNIYIESQVGNITLEDLIIDRGAIIITGEQTARPACITLKNVSVWRSPGAFAIGCNAPVDILKLEDCHVNHSAGVGVWLKNCAWPRLLGCLFQSNIAEAIRLQNCSGSRIHDCYFDGNGRGIYIYRGWNHNIDLCTFEGAEQTPSITLEDTDKAQIHAYDVMNGATLLVELDTRGTLVGVGCTR